MYWSRQSWRRDFLKVVKWNLQTFSNLHHIFMFSLSGSPWRTEWFYSIPKAKMNEREDTKSMLSFWCLDERLYTSSNLTHYQSCHQKQGLLPFLQICTTMPGTPILRNFRGSASRMSSEDFPLTDFGIRTCKTYGLLLLQPPDQSLGNEIPCS